MQKAPEALNAIAILLAKVFTVVLVTGVLGGYAGPVAVNAHDNLLLAVGALCFLGAGASAILGWFWVGASLRPLLHQRKSRR